MSGASLYEKSVERFDHLRSAKKLFYEASEAEVITDDHDVQVRIIPSNPQRRAILNDLDFGGSFQS